MMWHKQSQNVENSFSLVPEVFAACEDDTRHDGANSQSYDWAL